MLRSLVIHARSFAEYISVQLNITMNVVYPKRGRKVDHAARCDRRGIPGWKRGTKRRERAKRKGKRKGKEECVQRGGGVGVIPGKMLNFCLRKYNSDRGTL